MVVDHPQKNEFSRRGMEVRRAVLGDAYVDKALQKAENDPFLLPFQQLATDFAWGTIWTRPGLDRKIRSFITLTCLATKGEYEEMRGHIRGAINNGATKEEICEVFLHIAAYCGLPVALHSSQVAKEVFDETGN
jgi:4-carboxymuconolactone decarboxylase